MKAKPRTKKTMVTVETTTVNTELAENAKHHELDRVLRDGTKEDYMSPLNETEFDYLEEGNRYTVRIPTGVGSYRRANCSKLFLTRYLTELGGNGLVQYGRMLHASNQHELLLKNVREQIARHEGSFMIRTLSNPAAGYTQARALLSPSYKRLDDDFIFPTIRQVLEGLPAFKELGGRNTGEKTFARWVTKEPVLTIGKRNIFIGFQITNSEVGQSGFYIEFFLCDGFCDNGMVFGMEELEVFYMKHSGKRLDTSRTGLLSNTPFANPLEKSKMEGKIQGRILEMVAPEKIDYIKELVLSSFERTFTKEPDIIIEKFGKFYECSEEEIDLAKELFVDEERHAYGLQAAFTAAGQRVESFDRRAELDRIGGMIVEQPRNQWDTLILAA